MTAEFRNEIDEAGKTVVLFASGELDARAAHAFDEAFQSLFKQGVHDITVDLSNVPYISSSSISVLIKAQDLSAAEGNQVRLRNLQAEVRQTLELVGIEHFVILE